MCCGNSILQKGLPFFYLHKIFYTLVTKHNINTIVFYIYTSKRIIILIKTQNQHIFAKEFIYIMVLRLNTIITKIK
ncbi:hypothetical protein AUF14_03885 [Enterococcus avium]|nr:hypothetical protein AUF14_03885 [Enterococcus avium]